MPLRTWPDKDSITLGTVVCIKTELKELGVGIDRWNEMSSGTRCQALYEVAANRPRKRKDSVIVGIFGKGADSAEGRADGGD